MAVGSRSYTFARDLKNFNIKTEEKFNKLLRAVSLELFNEVITGTPRDTGTAAANWQCALGFAPSGILTWAGKKNKNPGGGVQRSIDEVNATVKGKVIGQGIFLVNNLPYIRKLEEGSSKQAPRGWVWKTIKRWGRAIDRAAQTIGKE